MTVLEVLRMTTKTYVEIDAAPWITQDGFVEVSVYLGDACEPCYIEKKSLKELIDQELNSYTIPGSDQIVPNHFEDVEELLKNLKDAYKYAKKRAKEMGVEL
jgi:Fe-S cluster biogenesis protein NfuA